MCCSNCNFDCDCNCKCNGNSSRNSRCSRNSVCDNIDTLREDLCDARTDLAAARANLANLARIICLNDDITSAEKEVLLALECNLSQLSSSLDEASCCAKSLDNKLC